MSDKKPPAEAPAESAPPKKKLPIKIIAVIAVLMVVEAAAVVLVFGMLGGPKASDAAVASKKLETDDSNEIKEIEIVSDKFQNLSTGRVWIWDMSIYVQVKNKNSDRVDRTLKQRNAEIKQGISEIVSKSQHAQLKEPERQSLNRQFSAFLNQIIGNDADGKPLIERVLIPKCRGFPSDY